jgi:hypothetical protein
MEQDHLSECFVTNASFFLLKSLLFNTSIRTALFVRFTMTLPQLFAHIDKEGLPILKLPTTEAVDQLDLQSVVPSAQMLQDQSQRMNLKKLKTIVTYWSARQIITYNVPPLVFIVAADTNVNTGALLNLYNDFQLIASEEPMNKL